MSAFGTRKKKKKRRVKFAEALDEAIKETIADATATKRLKNSRRRDRQRAPARVKALSKYGDLNRLWERVKRLIVKNKVAKVRVVRETGLIENVCEHGVGHPDPASVKLMQEKGPPGARGSWGVHGCDGCCSKEATK